MREGSQRAVQMATDRSNSQYQAYGGQRISDLSRNEEMGVSMARNNANAGQEDFASSREALGQMGSFTDEGVSERYMNPYMKEVVAPGLRRKNEAFEAERAQRRANRGMNSAFGGRGQMWDNQYEKDFQESQDEFMGSAYGAAYDSAAGLHGREQDQLLGKSAAYSDLGVTKAQENRSRIYDLMNSGLVERTQDQADKDFQYIEHLESRDWDVNNLSTLVSTLAGVPSESTQTSDSSTTEEKSPNAMKMIAGVAMIAAGVMTGGAALAPMVSAGGSMFGGDV